MKSNENEFPPEVKWIKACCRGTHFKLPDDLPSADDVQKLIDTATNARDKALISVLYESGCRIGELLTLRVKNVEFDDYGAVLHVNGKTGPRRVRIIHSVLGLQTWCTHSEATQRRLSFAVSPTRTGERNSPMNQYCEC